MKFHWFLQYATGVHHFRAEAPPDEEQEEHRLKKDPGTLQKGSAGEAPDEHEKTSKNAPKTVQQRSPNGLFFKLSARSLPTASRRRQKTPPGTPKDAPRAPKGGPRDPQRPPGPPRGGPKWLKIQQVDLGPPPGRPKRRPRRLRRPFWGDFGFPGTYFFSLFGLASGLRFLSVLQLPSHPATSQTKQPTQKHTTKKQTASPTHPTGQH